MATIELSLQPVTITFEAIGALQQFLLCCNTCNCHGTKRCIRVLLLLPMSWQHNVLPHKHCYSCDVQQTATVATRHMAATQCIATQVSIAIVVMCNKLPQWQHVIWPRPTSL
jgi:hypothetical protein